MSKSKKPTKRKSNAASQFSARRELEWVGGRFRAPFSVTEGGSFQPDAIIWFELPTGYLVGSHIIDPAAPISFAESLQRALARPMAGRPRRPDRIRVESPLLAGELQSVVGDSIPIAIAPTPELHEVIEVLQREGMPESEEEDDDGDGDADDYTYLADGRIPEASMRALFAAARDLFAAAPWTRFGDGNVLRFDAPALGIEAACISVLGNQGRVRGFALFPSQLAFQLFVASTRNGLPEKGPVNLGTGYVALEFDTQRQLPPCLVREVASYGWPLASPDAYPSPLSAGQDGVQRPIEVDDCKVLTAATAALARIFTADNEALMRGDPVLARAAVLDSIEGFVSYPYDGRPKPIAFPANHLRLPDAVNRRLADAMVRFGTERFGTKLQRALAFLRNAAAVAPFSLAYVLFRHPIDGVIAADAFDSEHGGMLNPDEREWFDGQRRAWTGLWEVRAVEPGASLDLRDLLSGERRHVIERLASQQTKPGEVFPTSVISFAGRFFLTGTYPARLPMTQALEVVRGVAEALGIAAGEIPVEVLEKPSSTRLLIERWERAVEAGARSP